MEYDGLNEVLKNINVSVVVYKVDREFHISMEYFNDRFAEIFGGDRAVIDAELKRDITFGVAEEYKEHVREMFHQAVITGEKKEAIYRAVTKTRAEIWVELKAVPVKNEKNGMLVYVTFFDITAQVKATEQVRRSEQYLQKACEFANIFSWVYEIDTKVIHPGKLLQDQIGLPAEMEDFPESVLKLHMVQPEYEDLYRRKIKELETGESQVEFEVQAKLLDGKSHWLAYRFDVVEYENNLPKIAVGTAQLVDVNKQMEARYQHEQKRKMVDDPSMIGYVVSNINGNEVIERRIIQEKLQFSNDVQDYEQVADAFAETIVSKDERAHWKKVHGRDAMLNSISNGTTAIEMELNVLGLDGVMRWVREVMNLVQHPDTGEILLYNYFYNIHDKKVFEELMSAMAEYGYEICGSLVADLDQISLIYAGKQKLVVGSYSLMNTKYSEDIIEEDRKRYQEATSINHILTETVNSKNGYEITHRTLEDGKIRYKKDQCYLYDRENQTYLLLRSDVTEVIEKEEEKRKRLQEALVEAELANQAKSNFLSRMSHELRTPINAINGYTALMEESVNTGKIDQKSMLESIAVTQNATKYLLAIIGDILDIQSIEQEKIKIKKELVDAKEYMKNVVDMIRQEAITKNIKFTYERKTHFSDFYMLDGPHFQQILLNILHNAVKFTPEGGEISMTAEAIAQTETVTSLRFVIKDNGIGMTPEFMDAHLFHKFAQENEDITSPYDGCGTGLFISQKLIQLMGGDITCESEKGKGSEFTICISAEHVAEKKRERRKRSKVSYDLSGIRVLLCEDNPLNQDMERKILERMNCQVDIADDGQIGVNRFLESDRKYYNIVLMDIRMPNIDGLEATRMIRGLDRDDAKEIPILAVSANAFDEDVRMSLEAGMNEHLAKPVDARILYQKIAEYCKNKVG